MQVSPHFRPSRGVLLAADVLVALLLGAAGVTAVLRGGRSGETAPGPWGYVIAVLAVVLLAGRRLAPRSALLVATASSVGCLLSGWGAPPLLLVAPLTLYLVAATAADRRTVWIYTGTCSAVFYVAALIGLGGGWSHPPSLLLVAWMAMAGAFGDAARSRRAYIAAIEERAERAERTREEEAQRRVIQERLRIARELHDVVAHHIAVINMQAGGATRALDRKPELARTALGHIGRACETVLKELASIVGVLRQSDDPDVLTEPAPGLDRLPQLLESVRAAGLDVAFTRTGTPRELPALVDLAAYRIVQESLTNAQKYGTGTAALLVSYAPSALTLEVVNPVAAGRASGAGNGLIGMRERAAAADGRLSARLNDDHFTVQATIPLDKE